MATQRAVVEATTGCLVDLGYAQTTMESIAERAQISRGAIMHHYESRADVIACTADYLCCRRLAEFESQVCLKLVQKDAPVTDAPSFRKAAALVMRFYELPSFIALHELLLAARTDKAIAALMRKIERRINSGTLELIAQHLPFWKQIPETGAVLTDLHHFLSRGIALSHPTKLDRKRQAALLDLVAQVTYETYQAAMRSH